MHSLVYDMYVRTVPRIAFRQIGHSLSVGAQSSQQTRWLHGRNNVEMSLSMHTLHSIESFRRRFSSFRLSMSTQMTHQVTSTNYKHKNYMVKRTFPAVLMKYAKWVWKNGFSGRYKSYKKFKYNLCNIIYVLCVSGQTKKIGGGGVPRLWRHEWHGVHNCSAGKNPPSPGNSSTAGCYIR